MKKFILFIITVGIVGMAVDAIKRTPTWIVVILFSTLIGILIFCVLIYIRDANIRNERALKYAKEYEGIARQNIYHAIGSHLHILAKKKLRLTEIDDYGIVSEDKWILEWDYFVNKVLKEKLNADDFDYFISQRTSESEWYVRNTTAAFRDMLQR